MVELELDDYKTLLNWFEILFAKDHYKMKLNDKKLFWKISLLCEDKIKEEKLNGSQSS